MFASSCVLCVKMLEGAGWGTRAPLDRSLSVLVWKCSSLVWLLNREFTKAVLRYVELCSKVVNADSFFLIRMENVDS